MEDINVNAIADTLNHKVDLPDGKSQSDIDYVVAFQKPTAANNYTWYRKYKSGWVEQGGIDQFASTSSRTATITLPITLTGNEYSIQMATFGSGGQGGMKLTAQSSTNFTYALQSAHDNFSGTKLYWQASGMAA